MARAKRGVHAGGHSSPARGPIRPTAHRADERREHEAQEDAAVEGGAWRHRRITAARGGVGRGTRARTLGEGLALQARRAHLPKMRSPMMRRSQRVAPKSMAEKVTVAGT